MNFNEFWLSLFGILLREIIDLSRDLEALYANAEVTKEGKTYHMEPEFNQIMSTSRDWEELLWAWVAWRNATGPKMKEKYTKMVDLMNEAALDNGGHLFLALNAPMQNACFSIQETNDRSLFSMQSTGYDDLSSSWREANYEMDKELVVMVDTLYEEIKPLYAQLHAYVRNKLVKAYPDHDMGSDGLIPAHILGTVSTIPALLAGLDIIPARSPMASWKAFERVEIGEQSTW